MGDAISRSVPRVRSTPTGRHDKDTSSAGLERGSMLAKMVEVLDLFSESTITLSAEDIADRMGVSRPTAFRYVKELTRVGFLMKLAGGYALGARIIELDYRIRRSDPILLASQPLMAELTELSDCSTLLLRVYGDEMVNIHEQPGRYAVSVTYGRGRPLPMFRGASKALVAHLGQTRLRRLYERHRDHPDVTDIATDFDAFSAHFQQIREKGYYLSRGEVDAPIIGVGAPIFADREAVAGLALVFDRAREPLINIDGVIHMTVDYAARIGEQVRNVIPGGV